MYEAIMVPRINDYRAKEYAAAQQKQASRSRR